MKKLEIDQAETIRKKFIPSWEIRKGKYLYKKIALDDYNQVLRFLMLMEKPQIELDHFADFKNFYNHLSIGITTHDVGGLTQLDFELALIIEEAIKQMGARTLEEMTSAGMVAGSMGGGNGFLNGGPGTLARAGTKKKKRNKKRTD